MKMRRIATREPVASTTATTLVTSSGSRRRWRWCLCQSLLLAFASIIVSLHRTDAAVKIGGIVGVELTRTKELMEEIIKTSSDSLPTQNRMHADIIRVARNETFSISNAACSQLVSGASVLVTPCGGTIHSALTSLSERLHIPYINAAATTASHSAHFTPYEYSATTTTATTSAGNSKSPSSHRHQRGDGEDDDDEDASDHASEDAHAGAGSNANPNGGSKASRGFQILMAPSTAKATADLIRANNWNNMYFIYDTDNGLNELEAILAFIPNEDRIQVLGAYQVKSPPQSSARAAALTPPDSPEVTKSALDVIKELERGAWDVAKHFVLAVDLKTAKRVVDHSYATKKAYHHYIVPRFSVPQFWADQRTFEQTTLSTIQLMDEEGYQRLKGMRGGVSTPKDPGEEHINDEEALLMDAGKLLAETMVKLSSEKPVASSHIFKELSQINASVSSCYKSRSGAGHLSSSAQDRYQHGIIIAETMKRITFQGATGDVRFDQAGRRTDFKFQILELNSRTKMSKVGEWSDKNGLQWDDAEKRSRISKQIREEIHRDILITTIINKPFLFYKSDNDTNPDLDNTDGYIRDLITKISERIPNRFNLRFVKDDKFGSRDSRAVSGWNGMIGELLRKEADVAIAPLTVTSLRSEVVHFSEPFMATAISAVARNEADDLLNIRTPLTFLRPLSWKIWFCFVGAYFVVGLVLLLINRLNLAVATPPPSGPVTACRHCYNSLWYAFGMFMSEECNHCRPKSLGSRVIACSWWLFILVVLSIYTAQLWISEPFSRQGEDLPSCVRQLLYQDKYQYGVVRGSAAEEFFQTTEDAEFREMYQNMRFKFNASLDPGLDSFSAAMDKVRNNTDFVLFSDANMIRYQEEHYPCDTVSVGQRPLRTAQYAIAMPRHFPLRKQFDDIIAKLRDDGFLTELENKWFNPKASECSGGFGSPETESILISAMHRAIARTTEAARPLGVRRVLGWFVILGLGLLVALFITVCEVYCKKRPRKADMDPDGNYEIKKKNRKDKKGSGELETQQLTAHEAPIGNTQVDEHHKSGELPDDATLRKRDEQDFHHGGGGGMGPIDDSLPIRKNCDLPPIADVEPFTDTDSSRKDLDGMMMDIKPMDGDDCCQ